MFRRHWHYKVKCLVAQLTLFAISNGDVRGSNPPSPNYRIIKMKKRKKEKRNKKNRNVATVIELLVIAYGNVAFCVFNKLMKYILHSLICLLYIYYAAKKLLNCMLHKTTTVSCLNHMLTTSMLELT